VFAFKQWAWVKISLVNPILNIRPAFLFIFSLILGAGLFPKVIKTRIVKNDFYQVMLSS